MGRKSKPPPPPDYAALAQQQGEINRRMMQEQTRANRPNQFGPWGSVSWEEGPDGQWTQRTSLDPRLQGALDSQIDLQRSRSDLANSMMGSVGESLSRPFDFGALPDDAGPIGTADQYASRAGDALYQQFQSRLNPRFQQEEEAMRARMTNMGFKEGDEGWDRAMRNFARDRNDAYDTAMRSAAQLAGSEASRLQGMDVTAGNFRRGLRDRALNERMMQRRMPLQEMNMLLQGQGVENPSFQSFSQSGLAEGPDMYGAARDTYQAQVAQVNARNAGRDAMFGGVTNLIGAGARMAPFFLSDARVKSVIGRIGCTARGTPVYLYRKGGEVQMGVLAQECPPEATRVRADGYLEVNYEAV